MPLADGATFAGYTIIRLLGAGGMGEVYLARHPRLNRQDALKVLTETCTEDAEYRSRFDREADVVAALWHPHIVGVHDRGEHEGKLWISMDYVDGIDAAELLQRNPSGLPLAAVVPIITAVAEALDYAHARHLLHRDVKPANILVADPGTTDERILLADFGIARRDDETNSLTATNMTVGTVSYAAPEQLMGTDLDGRADQYALAATAFHLLTGSPPFSHSNPAVVISQHLTAAPPRLGGLRPELAPLDPALTKALSKNPADRYARCLDFARALGNPQAGTPITEAAGFVEPTQLAPASHSSHTHRAAAAPKPAWLRPAVLLPAVLAVLLVAAVAFAVGEFEGDRATTSGHTTARTTARTSPPAAATAAPAPPTETVTDTTDVVVETETETEITTTDASADATVVVGGTCSQPGATATTAEGATAYCSNLQYTDRYLWSLSSGVIPNPVVTTSPATAPPYETESPVRICMDQTGHSRLRCAEQILRGNAQ
ncbi:serine/threonine-protein kinase [Mycolicibacterium confluentis]|uniref:non-specific serine/threonine protein kinase n=1 Tax=Mycolicibacterium confluentis TaxID=28047 RepID=A0A7I7XWP0_9MYCO|nr:serine/threonine-protein kinase [Mycolicibacterium confluentis]MCV7321634.1 serine/threonine protein kinase [Mycolicibacterium confluentis]ORV31929.1 serine/threonine protein kinase [Mycolicibacterium confluentis]BBZ33443.1 serine/threonine-protein kinase PknF [Mycolicibacterium confluentis]